MSLVDNTMANEHYQEEMFELSKRQSKKYWERKEMEAKTATEVTEPTLIIPGRSSLWRHKKTGRGYTVLEVANLNATKPGWKVTVVYVDSDHNVWARDIESWNESMEPLVL